MRVVIVETKSHRIVEDMRRLRRLEIFKIVFHFGKLQQNLGQQFQLSINGLLADDGFLVLVDALNDEGESRVEVVDNLYDTEILIFFRQHFCDFA